MLEFLNEIQAELRDLPAEMYESNLDIVQCLIALAERLRYQETLLA